MINRPISLLIVVLIGDFVADVIWSSSKY